MKKTIAILTAIAALGLSARGADNVTSNYFANTVTVLATSTNMGDTGLTLSVDYLAVPLTSLSGVTTGDTADVRAVLYGIAQTYYTAWSASTNQSSSTIARTTRYEATSSNVTETVAHALRTVRTASTFTLE